jgi:hypothetical protein
MPRSRQTGQGTLFEDDYLVRTLGTLAYKPDVALTELVANAWDAGASSVEIRIPESLGDSLVVQDDGSGMTPEAFRRRWMTLGYDRVKHQGRDAEFPPERAGWRRRAYGNNGVGRHGLLCFGSEYLVESWRDGAGARYTIKTTSGQHPFRIAAEEPLRKSGHGTSLQVVVERHLPAPDPILAILAARFLHDPQFVVRVNGRGVPLAEHTGLIEDRHIQVTPGVRLHAYFVDTTESSRTTQYQGVAFWVGNRLVGEPAWVVGGVPVLDGRTRLAKRYTAILQSDDLLKEVLPDWSGFRDSDTMRQVYQAAREYVGDVVARLSRERRAETKAALVQEHADEIRELQPLGRLEVREFIEAFTYAQPQAAPEVASAAVQALITIERSRRGRSLLEKLSRLNEDDIEGLDALLSAWTVRDALTVLEEIDGRVHVLEAIERLSSDPATDELHTLHPLITQARWLFGPEFDSPEYTANVTLSTAVRKLLGKRVVADTFLNDRRRPDLLMLADATVSVTGTDRIDEETGLATLNDALIIELKKGAANIGRVEMDQATGYLDDLLQSNLLDGAPSIRAFVVGHTCSSKTQPVRKIGESDRGVVRMTTYSQLIRTGNKRLFNLKERLSTRYGSLADEELLLPSRTETQLDLLGGEREVG